MAYALNKIRNVRVCFSGKFTLSLEEDYADMTPGPGQLVIENMYTLISPGTELALYTGTHIGFSDPANTFARFPFYPGYAAVGRVVALGEGVRTFHEGDLVYHEGHHQRYDTVTLADKLVLPLPNDIDTKHVPFARLAQISNTALQVSHISAGDVVAVFGLGLIGNMAAQLAEARNAMAVGADLIGFRRELASRCGIGYVCNGADDEMHAAIDEITAGRGVSTAIEATGDPQLIASALEVTAELGDVILLGSPRGTVEIDPYKHIHRRGVSLKGAHVMLMPGRPDGTGRLDRMSNARLMLQAIASGQLEVNALISHVITPQQLENGYRALLDEKDSTMAVIVDWQQT